MTNEPQVHLTDEDLVGRFVKCRIQRSVTTYAHEGHVDFVIDIVVPSGVPLAPGSAILVHEDDIVTPISHVFWDHHAGQVVITTNAVVYRAGISLEEAVADYVGRGWQVVEPTPADAFPLAHSYKSA